MTSADRIAVRVRIEGRVQGVWYRGWTVEQASGRGLDGWVRNRPDGSVEALFAGPRSLVEAMVAACSSGPPAAKVRDVIPTPDADPGPIGFAQRATG